jgi:putative endonuclease
MNLPYCVYVLKSRQDKQLYIGFSSNLKQRLSDHFNGKVDSTSHRCPLDLIFCEYHPSKDDALRREGYFKTGAGKRAIKLMLREALSTKP